MNALPLPAIAEDIWDMKYRLKDNQTGQRRTRRRRFACSTSRCAVTDAFMLRRHRR